MRKRSPYPRTNKLYSPNLRPEASSITVVAPGKDGHREQSTGKERNCRTDDETEGMPHTVHDNDVARRLSSPFDTHESARVANTLDTNESARVARTLDTNEAVSVSNTLDTNGSARVSHTLDTKESERVSNALDTKVTVRVSHTLDPNHDAVRLPSALDDNDEHDDEGDPTDNPDEATPDGHVVPVGIYFVKYFRF
jgi:hypothetical protein